MRPLLELAETPPRPAHVVTTVHDLSTGTEHVYTLPAREAIVAAHAQIERRDYNTHGYSTRYAGTPVRRVGMMLNIGTLYATEVTR